MKTRISILFLMIFVLLTKVSFLQADWIRISSPVSSNLNSIKFINTNTGIVVGNYGVILKTTNGGNNWVQKNSNQSLSFFDFCFVNSQTIIAVGGMGIIVRSTDLGETWSDISTPISGSLLSIYFVDNSIGFALGINSVIKTTDSGLNWQLISSSSSGYYSCKFFDVNTGISTSSDESIKRTTNGGINWITIFNTPNIPRGLFFINNNTGFVVGMLGFILKSTNSGNNWTTVRPIGNDCDLNCGKFLNESFGLIVGRLSQIGFIFKTTNNGNNWEFLDSLSGALYGVDFSDNYAVIVGDSGKIYKSDNPIGISNISSEVPNKYNLSQNYPNPFNPTTYIEFSIPKKSHVKLIVFDNRGKEISTLVNENLSIGTFKVNFIGDNLPSGVYFYQMTTESYKLTKKMILIK